MIKKAVILAGGKGTRISEESMLKPKPMIEIGGKPILWHIMKLYSHYNINEFIICLGYKGYLIKEYFSNYFLHQSDVTVDLSNNTLDIHKSRAENWKITLIDTGLNTLTGGRLKRIEGYIDEPFLMTYGDGVSNVNISKLIDYHNSHSKLATLTAVQPTGRFGSIVMKDSTITSFKEKPKGDGSWINGGFFVLDPAVFSYITEGDDSIFERTPLENLASENELMAFKHDGFWKPMDTLRDRQELENLWESENAPWKIWND